MTARHQNFITEARNHAKALWDAQQALQRLQSEWSAQDYGTTLSDGEGANTGITAVEVGSVVHATSDAIETVMGQGHATNLTNLL